MSLTLGMTGMDHATETALKAAFTHANARLNRRWELLPETEADHVMVDMDSMYGPMSWLRLHAAGKRVIGLTTAQRTQTDFRLGRPFDSDSFCDLLRNIATAEGIDLADKTPAVDVAPASVAPADAPKPIIAAPIAAPIIATPPPPPAPAPAPAQVAGITSAPMLKEPPAQDVAPTLAETPTPATRSEVEVEAEPVPAPAPAPAPAPPARDPVFADWLAPAALPQHTRYQRGSGPPLLIDSVAQTYHGPATLKPLAGYFEGNVQREDFKSVDDATWARESVAAGAAQALSRLQWLGGLVAGKGALLPGLDPDGRYKLGKWPQTEREYPKHFRIATAMMRGPATVAEIAAASSIPVADVADFINANLITGFAEFVPEPTIEPAPAAKPAGLFGRLRGR